MAENVKNDRRLLSGPPAASSPRRVDEAPVTRVLLVEDEEALREVVADLLSGAGYEVVAAADGSEGLRLLWESGPYDLLILDEDMPGLTGRRLLAAARSAGTRVPAVVWSGRLEIGEAERLELGIGAVLRKPVAFEALEDAIRAVLRQGRDKAEPKHRSVP